MLSQLPTPMTIDDLLLRHPTTLRYQVLRLALLPATWLPLVHDAFSQVERPLTPEELEVFVVGQIGGEFDFGRTLAWVHGAAQKRWRELYGAFRAIFLEAESALAFVVP